MTSSIGAAIVALALGTSAPPNASAPDRNESLEDALAEYVAREVRVKDQTGMSLDGAIVSIRDGQLEVLTRGGTRTVPLDSIATVKRHGDSVKNGFVIGAVFGALTGLMMTAEYGDVATSMYATAVSATIYGLVGAGIDALYDGWTPVYVRKDKGPHSRAGNAGAMVKLRLRF